MIASFDDFIISPVHLGDAWKICDFVVTNEERFKPYFPRTLKENLTPALSQLFVEKKLKAFQNNTEFLFTLKQAETRKLAGLIYLKNLDWKEKRGELAYCVGYNFSGNQLMSRAVRALLPYALKNLKLEHLIIVVNKDNLSSIKVATSNKFIWTNTLKNEFTPLGEKALDMELYELRMK